MKYELPILKYKYSDLEPFIDAQTMEIHHSKHHQTYINNLNVALEKHTEIDMTIEDLLNNLGNLPEDIKMAVRNNGGGHFNHSLFWNILKPASEKENIPDKVIQILTNAFDSLDNFKTEMNKIGMARFGSGWVWLIVDKQKQLKIISTANQDCPLSEGHFPIFGIDVWEHAYYLKYQNRRADYLENIWNVINWKRIEENLIDAGIL